MELPQGLGELNIAEALASKRIFRIFVTEKNNRDSFSTGKNIYLFVNEEYFNVEELALSLFYEIIKAFLLEKRVSFEEADRFAYLSLNIFAANPESTLQQLLERGIINDQEYDEMIKRARALSFILGKSTDLLAGLPDYAELPKINSVFPAGSDLNTDIQEIIMENNALLEVIFGLRKAALIDDLILSPEEEKDLRHVLRMLDLMLLVPYRATYSS